MGQFIQEWTKYNLWKTAFKKLNGYGLLKQTISVQIFKGCFPQILLGPFLNILSHKIWVL